MYPIKQHDDIPELFAEMPIDEDFAQFRIWLSRALRWYYPTKERLQRAMAAFRTERYNTHDFEGLTCNDVFSCKDPPIRVPKKVLAAMVRAYTMLCWARMQIKRCAWELTHAHSLRVAPLEPPDLTQPDPNSIEELVISFCEYYLDMSVHAVQASEKSPVRHFTYFRENDFVHVSRSVVDAVVKLFSIPEYKIDEFVKNCKTFNARLVVFPVPKKYSNGGGENEKGCDKFEVLPM